MTVDFKIGNARKWFQDNLLSKIIEENQNNIHTLNELLHFYGRQLLEWQFFEQLKINENNQ